LRARQALPGGDPLDRPARPRLARHPTNRQAPYWDTVLVEAGGDAGIYDFAVDIEELRRNRRNVIWGAPHRQVGAYADLVADGFGQDLRPDRIISRGNPRRQRGDPLPSRSRPTGPVRSLAMVLELIARGRLR